MTRKIIKSTEGFTLIEMLLYLAIAAFILLGISVFLSAILESRIKGQAIAEVESQGLAVMSNITQTIRNASAINLPTIGSSASSLSLTVPTSSKSPTIFNSVNGSLRITEGASPTIELTNEKVTTSGLSFSNLSRVGTKGIIRIQFTLTHINPQNKNEYNFSQTFYGSAALR